MSSISLTTSPLARLSPLLKYILADIPSNLLLKRFGSKLIVILVLGFGLISLASTFITNYTGLIVTRIFLGIFEGGTLVGLLSTPIGSLSLTFNSLASSMSCHG